MLGYVDLAHRAIPEMLVIAEHLSYRFVIRLVDAEFDSLGGYRLFFGFAVFSLPEISKMLVDRLDIFRIDVALLAVRGLRDA